jgi:hypothetical protein
MATPYYSWTVLIPEADIPADLGSHGELPDAVSAAMGQQGAIMATSRNDWLHSTLSEMFTTLGGSALSFLVKDPESLQNIDAEAFRPFGGIDYQEVTVVTKLPFAEVPSAAEEVGAWLRTIATEPWRFPDLLGEDCSREDAAAAIDEAEDLRDLNSHEDGDYAPYLFSYLKSLRTMLRDALAHEMAVVHVRFTFLFRKSPAA